MQANRGRKCDRTTKECIGKVPCLCQAEQKKRNRRYILHPTQSFTLSKCRLKAHNRAPRPYTTQSCENFRPAPLFFVNRRLFVRGGSTLTSIITPASSGSLNPTYFFAVAVIVVALGRSLYCIFFPVASSLVSAASNSTDEPPNP